MKKILLVLSLSTLLLTACSGRKAHTDAPKEPESSQPATQTETSSVATVEEPTEAPAEAPAKPAASFSHGPTAVDPTPYWEGDDFFDIERYLEDCGMEVFFHVITTGDITQNRILFWTEDIDGFIKYDVFILEKEATVNQEEMELVVDLYQSDKTTISVSKTEEVVIGPRCLEYLFAAMPRIVDNINQDGCPLAGVGIGPKHTDIHIGSQRHDH